MPPAFLFFRGARVFAIDGLARTSNAVSGNSCAARETTNVMNVSALAPCAAEATAATSRTSSSSAASRAVSVERSNETACSLATRGSSRGAERRAK